MVPHIYSYIYTYMFAVDNFFENDCIQGHISFKNALTILLIIIHEKLLELMRSCKSYNMRNIQFQKE